MCFKSRQENSIEVFVNKFFKLIGLSLCASISFLPLAHAKATEQAKLCQEGDSSCTFVLLSEQGGSSVVINAKRAKQQMTPYSTFKIANSLIGLDTGIIKDAKQTLSYDKEKYPVQAWWPPVWKLPKYDLVSAYKFSMVAVYRQLANDIGEADMKKYLKLFAYGNQDISSGLDNFWLNKSIKISANEQISFLQKLYHNEFSVKESALTTLKEVMLAEQGEDYKIFAKTGAGQVDDGSMLGWYVGFVENQTGVHYFAFNFNRDTYKEMKADRIQMVTNHLKAAGLI